MRNARDWITQAAPHPMKELLEQSTAAMWSYTPSNMEQTGCKYNETTEFNK